jgi:hypothetical protein
MPYPRRMGEQILVVDDDQPILRMLTSEASIQLHGHTFAMPGKDHPGTVTIGQSMRDGAFALRLRDAALAAGSWTCGAERYWFEPSTAHHLFKPISGSFEWSLSSPLSSGPVCGVLPFPDATATSRESSWVPGARSVESVER